MAQRPSAIGLHVCERIIIEEHTQYVSLVSSFRRRYVEHDPPECFPFTVYAELVGGHGQVPLEIVITRLDTFDEILRQQTTVQFAGPLQILRVRLEYRTFTFPHLGYFDVALIADGEPIARRRIQLVRTGATNE